MSDIHQEWRELRQKNGDFICHLDGEMAKLEKEKKQMFYDPMTCTYYMAALDDTLNNNAQYWQEKHAELMLELKDAMTEINNLKEENKRRTDQIQKAAADYQALSHESLKLTEDIKRRKDSDKKMGDAYAKLIEENAFLQKQLDAAQKEVDDFTVMYDKAHAEAHQAKVAKDRMGYSNRCMQSKIAKQANEIKRLAHENVGLVIDMKRYRNEIEKLKQGHWDEMERLQNANAKLEHDNFQLKQALGTSAKDAEVNFNRGRIKGMEEIWYELKDAYDGRPIGENQKIFGCNTVGDMLMNLSPTWFINRAEEYHEQEDKKTKDIQIGDEVEILDPFCPNDNPHSDIGIVIVIDKDNQCFTVIGPKFEGCFDETDIDSGRVRKTGQHFDSIPLDYFN